MVSLTTGKVTNLVVVSQSSLLNSTSNQRKVSNGYCVSPLDKYLQGNNSFKGTTTFLSACQLPKANQTCTDFKSAGLMTQKVTSLQVFPFYLNNLHLLTHNFM